MKERLARLRQQHPWLDHVFRMQGRYGSTDAGQQAGAVTYFAFLSFFPVLALAFFVVGLVSHVYPDANENLKQALNSVLPGLVGGDNGISLADIRTFSGLAGVIGLLGVLYSGLGWLSALRTALETVFETPQRDQPGFVVGKLRDAATLAVLGLVLFVSVPLAGFIGGFSGTLLGFVGLDQTFGWLVKLITVVLGLVANAVLFFSLFRLLAAYHVPNRSLWHGAALGAVGFEVLKQVASLLFASTSNSPAFRAFGVALILLVWINYFSRLVLYAACWAATTRDALALHAQDVATAVHGPPLPSGRQKLRIGADDDVPAWRSFLVGAGLGALAGGVARRRLRPER